MPTNIYSSENLKNEGWSNIKHKRITQVIQ